MKITEINFIHERFELVAIKMYTILLIHWAMEKLNVVKIKYIPILLVYYR